MHIPPLALVAATALALTACAVTPEQKAARAEAQKRYEQNLQVSLAAQCDRETAALMRRQFDETGAGTALTETQKTFRLEYIDKVSDPMFQACYKMAWQNYLSQRQLQEMRHYYDWYDFHAPFRRHPFFWR